VIRNGFGSQFFGNLVGVKFTCPLGRSHPGYGYCTYKVRLNVTVRKNSSFMLNNKYCGPGKLEAWAVLGVGRFHMRRWSVLQWGVGRGTAAWKGMHNINTV
jgi:hypothetical protein